MAAKTSAAKPHTVHHRDGVEAGRVTASGGRMQREKMSIGQYGFIALAFDTEGNMFGLHSMK